MDKKKRIKFNENFEKIIMYHGTINYVGDTIQRVIRERDRNEANLKDLGVITSGNLEFQERLIR